MPDQRFDIEGAVTVEATKSEGHLTVTGGSEPAIVLSSSESDAYDADLVEGMLRLRVRRSTRMQVPAATHVRVLEPHSGLSVRWLKGSVDVIGAQADVTIKDVEGDLLVRDGHGDLIADVVQGTTTCDNWQGDVSFGGVRGSLKVSGVNGDIRVKDADGPIELRRSSGDVRVEGAKQALLIATCGGDLRVRRQEGNVVVSGGVTGSVRIESVGGSVAIDNIQGNLKALELRGALHVTERVQGDIAIAGVTGTVALAGAAGSLRATNLEQRFVSGNVDGDAFVRSAQGDVTCGDVRGELRLEQIGGAITAQSVGGDLTVQQCSASVQIGPVGGSARISKGAGSTSLESINGDLKLTAHDGNFTCTRVHGHANVSGTPAAGGTYRIETEADGQWVIPEGADVTVTAVSERGSIRCELPLTERRETAHTLEGVLGKGASTVDLKAQGDIRIGRLDDAVSLDAGDFDFASLGKILGDTMARTMRSAFADASTAGVDFQQELDATLNRARRASERAASRMAAQAERARRRAEDASRWMRAPQGWTEWSGGPHVWHAGREAWSGEKGAARREKWIESGRDLGRIIDEAVDTAMRSVRQGLDSAVVADIRQRVESAIRDEFRSTFGRDVEESVQLFRDLKREQGWPGVWQGVRNHVDSTSAGGGSSGEKWYQQHTSGAQATKTVPDADPRVVPFPSPASDVNAAATEDLEARRVSILSQLREGRISVEEAERQLDQLG